MRVRFEGLEIGSTERRHGDVVISDMDFGSTEYVTADQQQEGRDGVTPGRDYLRGTIAAFTISSNQRTMRQAREVLSEFLAAWRDRKRRLTPGLLVPLEYSPLDMDGEWFRIYGRPRSNDSYIFDHLMRQGVGTVNLEFEQLEPRFFAGGEAGEQQATIRATAAASGTGWTFPLTFPVSSPGPPEPASTVITVSGSEPTPPIIEFHGPGRRFQINGNAGWHMGLDPDVELAADEVITIDPLSRTVTDNFGRPRSVLDLRSALGQIELHPGTETLFFSAEDVTGTAHAIIRWRDAYASA
ncbi:hypothetical protein [Nesterenkonia rhizosphaerae]|uniref:Phage tail protein n=1 Tax=Nesterenkonia rhizosphaerae TaxID=1348272 RepID=A0ABP9G657_9MICC